MERERRGMSTGEESGRESCLQEHFEGSDGALEVVLPLRNKV